MHWSAQYMKGVPMTWVNNKNPHSLWGVWLLEVIFCHMIFCCIWCHHNLSKITLLTIWAMNNIDDTPTWLVSFTGSGMYIDDNNDWANWSMRVLPCTTFSHIDTQKQPSVFLMRIWHHISHHSDSTYQEW